MLPIDADKQHNTRMKEKKEFVVKAYVSLDASSRRVDISAEFDNCVRNHRIRALFPSGVDSRIAYADGQFDIVERPVKPWTGWENPSNCQRQQAFAGLHDGDRGLLIANRGLPEYEVLQDDKHTLALTLIRGVAELGDWGEFPTPGAQCLGPQRVEYSIIPFAGEKELEGACRLAYQFNTQPFAGIQTNRHEGILGTEYSFVGIDGRSLILSAMKKAEDREGMILRVYNPWKQDGVLEIPQQQAFGEVFRTNLEEVREAPVPITDSMIRVEIPSKKIVTLEFTINPAGREVKK
jgi:alpha-mannosidase/mannosylglycerate hydrolase